MRTYKYVFLWNDSLAEYVGLFERVQRVTIPALLCLIGLKCIPRFSNG